MSRVQLPLDIEDHITLGNGFKQAEHNVRFMLSRLPAGAAVARDGGNALAAIDDLKWKLDAMLCALVPPKRDPRQLARQVYFGSEQLGLRQYARAELDADVFAMWAPFSDPRMVSVCPPPPRYPSYEF